MVQALQTPGFAESQVGAELWSQKGGPREEGVTAGKHEGQDMRLWGLVGHPHGGFTLDVASVVHNPWLLPPSLQARLPWGGRGGPSGGAGGGTHGSPHFSQCRAGGLWWVGGLGVTECLVGRPGALEEGLRHLPRRWGPDRPRDGLVLRDGCVRDEEEGG